MANRTGMESNPEFKYIAFISYSSANLNSAVRLKRRLLNFHLPSFMKTSRTNEHLNVFMADKDFNEHKVLAGLHRKLDESQFLIVVCSPDSAKSPYCEEEVSYFIRTGRADKIIPYIISGKPNTPSGDEECYVPSLRNLTLEQQISGIYIPNVGPYNGYLMVVSRLLHIEYDSIKVEDWKRRRTNYLVLSFLTAFIIAGGIILYNYFSPHYEYYADYIDKNGIAEGIIPVNKEEREHRPQFYKFEYRRNRLYSTSLVNSYGNKIEHNNSETNDRPCEREFQYSKRGGLEVVCKNALGQNLWVEVISPDKSIVGIKKYESDQGVSIMRSFSALSERSGMQATEFDLQDIEKTSKSTIRGYLVTRDDDGYITQKIFTSTSDNSSDEPGCDENGIEGVRYVLDSLHRIEQIIYINKEGDIMSDKMGISSKTYRYDKHGNLCVVKCRNKKKRLATNEDFWAISTIEYNEFSQPIMQRQYDNEHNLCNDCLGVAIVKNKWDSRGMLLETAFFDNNGEKVTTLPNSKNIPIAHRCVMTYDKRGRVAESRFFDDKDNPISMGKGSYYCYEYDTEGHVIRESCRGENGELTYGPAGSYVRLWYSNNNRVREEYYDKNGRLFNTIDGFSYIISNFDNNNRLIREEYYNKYGALVPHWRIGNACGVILDYNKRSGNLEKLSFLNMEGKISPNMYGIAVQHRIYDKRGLCIEERNTSADDILLSMCKSEYDNHGNCTRREWYDGNEELMISSDKGCAILVAKYNDKGQMTEINSFGTHNERIINNQGWATNRIQYDNRGNVISYSFFDEKDLPLISLQQGAHKFEYKYKGNLCSAIENYDIKGNKMKNKMSGAWKITFEYSRYGNLIHTVRYDENNEKTNGLEGFCEEFMEYNEFNSLISHSFWDKYGHRAMSKQEGFSYVKNDYLECGYQCRTAFFDDNDGPINGPEGFHSMRAYFDSHNNVYFQECRDNDGTLAYCPQWNAVAIESAFDSNGQFVYQSSLSDKFGAYNFRRLLLDTLGFPQYVFQDDRGNYQFSKNGIPVDFKVEDYEQLDSLIEVRIQSHKKQYSKFAAIEYPLL